MPKRFPSLAVLALLLALGVALFWQHHGPTAGADASSPATPAPAGRGAGERAATSAQAARHTPGRPGARPVPTGAAVAGNLGRAPAVLPLAEDFLEKIMDAAGQRVDFTLPDGRAAEGAVELVRHDAQGVLLVQGRLTLPEPGFYFFQRQTVPGVAGAMVGSVRFDKSRVAFRVEPAGAGGAPMLVERSIEQVICYNLQAPDLARMAAAEPQEAPQTHPTDIPIPEYQNGVIPLQSLPGATGVIYLDFDGEKGPFVGWGSFDAAPSGASNAQIKEVWQRVAEDFAPFNINVTTDRRVFDNAGSGHRQRCILTPTTTAAPGAGGGGVLHRFLQ